MNATMERLLMPALAVVVLVLLYIIIRNVKSTKRNEANPAVAAEPAAAHTAPASLVQPQPDVAPEGAVLAAIMAAITCVLAQEGKAIDPTGFVVRRIRRA